MTTVAPQDGRLALSAHGVRVQLAALVNVIDTAHAHGLDIPQKVGESLAVVGALADAWESNSRGVPASSEAKALLGIHVCTCDGVREHYCRKCGALTCACAPCDCPPCDCEGR